MNRISLLSLLLLVSLTGCIKESDFNFSKSRGIEIDGTYGTALFNDEFTALEMLKRYDSLNQIFINDEGYISYIAGQNSSSLIGNDYIVLTDQTFSNSMSISPSVITAFNSASIGTSVFDSSTFDWVMNLNPYEIDSIIYKEGTLNLQLSSTLTIPVSISFMFESLLQPNGNSFSNNFTIPSASSASSNTDISGYKADLTLNGSNTNRLRVKMLVRLDKQSVSDNILPGQQLNYDLNFQNQKFKRIFGYFGNEPLSIPTKNLEIGLFELASGQGNIVAEDPRLNLYFDNTYGMKVQIQTLSPFMAKKQDASLIPITGVTLPFSIERPQNIYDSKQSKLTLKSPQVNVKQLIESKITEIIFGAGAKINPDGITKNFALDTSRVTMTSEIELPFYGSFKNFGFEDTSDFTPPKDAEIIEYAEIKLIVENTLPIGLNFQIYFLDSSTNQTVDSLFKDFDQTHVIPSANVDANGKVINTVHKTTFFRVNQAMLKKLNERNATKIRIRAEALSFNNGNTPVKVFPDNKIVIKAGVKVKAKGIIKQ
ncbi:MAG: hypothetical protein J5I91_07650 [Bacteroidetes bacterium]|nr:hypothetical protein [Bacteroidota bacterium]